MKQNNFDRLKIANSITILDGIAILCIVLLHSILYYASSKDNINEFYILASNNLGVFGICLFTFSSGFKIVFNHFEDLGDKFFLRNYFIKRLFRLYKPYLGCTLLSICILNIIPIIRRFMHISNEASTSRYDGTIANILFRILLGDNPFMYKLWYLFVLLIITSICLMVLYISSIETLFKLSIFILGICLFHGDTLANYHVNLFRISEYLIIFVAGMFFAYELIRNSKLYVSLVHISSLIFIGIVLLSLSSIRFEIPIYIISQYPIFVFGFTVPQFALEASNHLSKINIFNIILKYCGKNSLYIYLFHTFPMDILHITSLNPFINVIVAVIASMMIYKVFVIIKMNMIFE